MSLMQQFWKTVLQGAVNARSVTGAIGEHPNQLATAGFYVLSHFLAPMRSVIPKITGRMYEIADELAPTEPQLANVTRLWARAGDEGFRMIKEVEERRRVIPARYVTTVLQAANERGLTRDNLDGWRNIKTLIEEGRADEHPVAQLLANIYGQIDNLAQRLIPGYKGRPNYFPQFASREYIEQLGETRFRELLKERHPMLTDDELKLAMEAVMNAPPRLVRDIDPLIRPSEHLLMRRRITLPDEARIHPMDEALLGIAEELTYLVDTSVLGWQGNKFWNLVRILRGEKLPLAVQEDLPASIRGIMQEIGEDALERNVPGKVTRNLGDALKVIAHYTMGHFPDDDFGQLRKGLAAVGVIEMMAFSVIPNLGQLFAEFIVRGFGPAARGIIRAGLGKLYWTDEAEGLKFIAAALGQSQVISRNFDLALGYNETTADLFRNPQKFFANPVGAAKDILSAFRVTGRQQGWGTALGRASREFLHLTGFTSAEDYLRRAATGAVQEELLDVQRLLSDNPVDARALRILKRYGIEGDEAVRKFMKMNLSDVSWTPQKLMELDPDAALKLTPWERLFMHGIDQTQFNYMPVDFPIAWAHPTLASTVFQFRRYSYQQATKLVNFAFQEAAAGNVGPLARMMAAAWGMGSLINAMRAGITGRDIVWVGGSEGFAKVPPPSIERAAEARGPFGMTYNEWMRKRLEDAVAMGLFGLYTDAIFTLAEGKPMLLASYAVGVYPAEAFNLVNKLAQGLYEALTGGERHPGKERFPKVKEAARYTVKQIPVIGRLAYPHLRSAPIIGSKPLEYGRLREFGLRAWVNKDWETFNAIQNRLLEEFENPITVEEAADYQMRLALKRRGIAAVRPRPGEPGYVPRGEIPLRPGEEARVEQKARERLSRFLAGTGLEDIDLGEE